MTPLFPSFFEDDALPRTPQQRARDEQAFYDRFDDHPLMDRLLRVSAVTLLVPFVAALTFGLLQHH